MKPRYGKKPTLKHKLYWSLEYLLFITFYFFFSFLPYRIKIKVGTLLGRLISSIDKKHKRVCFNNLKETFKDLDDEEINKLLIKNFEHIGRLFIEIIYIKKHFKQIFNETKIEGMENLLNLTHQKKGYFLVSGHFGNWEFIAYLQGILGYPLNMVVRPLDNPYLEKFLRKTRESSGNEVIYKRNAVKEIVKKLKKGEGVAFVFDQNFGEEGAIFVPFLGRLAATTPTLGKISSKLNVPILPVYSFREGKGYKIVYEKIIFPEELNYDPYLITKRVTETLEEKIKKFPYLWFFMHDRWRTRPEEMKEKKLK